MDEPPEPEEGPSEENVEQSEGEAELPEEEAEEGNEHSEAETEAGHSRAATEQSNQEEEIEQLEGSPPRDPVGEDELAAILANMGEYGPPSSPVGLPEGPPEEEAPGEVHAEKAGEESLHVYDEENVDTNREQSVPKTPEETLDGVGAELRASHEPSAEAREIKKLRRKQQKLLSTIAQLWQQIRILKAHLRIRRTAGRRRRDNTARSRRMRRRGTYSCPAGQNPAGSPTAVPINNKEQNVAPTDMEQQTAVPNSPRDRTAVPIKTEEQDDIPFTEGPQQPFIRVKKEKENKGIQTDAPPLGVNRVLNSKQRNKKVQVKLPASTVSWNKDPKTRTLHHMMKQV